MDAVDVGGKLLAWSASVGEQLANMGTPAEVNERLARVRTHLGPYGVDPFGFDPEYARRFLRLGSWLYHQYFRCEAFGLERLPPGRALLVANHSGQLPYDGMMIAMACFLRGEPPRAVRSMVDRFVPNVPFVSFALARLGQVLGTPSNCRRLLENEECIQVFPEGVSGLNKPYRQRYQLQRFGQGFMRLALEAKAPIVPVAVVGAEEQAPSLSAMRPLAKLFGLPALPLTPAPLCGLVPLPVRYRLHFGEPMTFAGEANEDDEAIYARVEQVRRRLQDMLDEGVRARPHVFW
jgi:1-acyl-sn-glycerol-3-phosphate acyltransferase